MSWFYRRSRGPLVGPAHSTLLRRSPRTRRRFGGMFQGRMGLLLAALGIGMYWYWVFGLSDDNPLRRRGPQVRSEQAAPAPAPAEESAHLSDAEEEKDEIDLLRERILAGAMAQLHRRMQWNASYVPLAYPGGDLPIDQGTGVDMLIRALRHARIDLQVLIHIDRVRHPEHYPLHLFGNPRPDTSIDHRRIENVWAFFNRHAKRLDSGISERALKNYLPGDIVFWGEGRMDHPVHVGIVSALRNDRGVPRAVELWRQEERVSVFNPITYRPLMGHFRLDPERLRAVRAPRQ